MATRLIQEDQLLEGDGELLERLINEIPVMVVIYDPAVRDVLVSRHFERVLGWTPEDLEEGDVMAICFPDPEYRAEVRRFMDALEPEWRDFDMRAKDGSMVPASWANIRLTDDRQVGIGVDVTERKKAEEQVRRALEQARAAVKERDHILAVVSHDLRNPLNTMVMSSSLLLEDISEEKKRGQVAIIRRAVDQMQHLIDDLLQASRIEAGGLRIAPQRWHCAELARAAVQSQAPLAEARSIAISEGEMPAVAIVVDFDRILQVFGNLLSNALEHTPEGGRVRVEATARSDDVVFSVRDSGRGIRQEDLPRIFDRFWQAEKSQRAGAGLGLSIAKGIVEAHGGKIWVESDPGSGTTFHFSVPMDRGT